MIDSLRPECIRIGSEAKNKEALLKEISELAQLSPSVQKIDASEIEQSLIKREELCSTGLGSGIAIPHCSLDSISEFTVGLVVLKKGIDFDSLDGEPVHLVFFIIGSAANRNKHIKILSSISKISKDQALYNNLINAVTPGEVRAMLTLEEEENMTNKPVEKCQFILHVQDEEIFSDVLEILSSEVEGDVSVLESTNAGSYLYKLPLFSTFWNDNSKSFSKVIIAVIDKRLMNDTIRRINLVRPVEQGGILISVADLLYFDGSIDF
ncbi:PTS sugar transporter subunit IIA [Oceanispirochaeta sp.]|jgi:mannitol/fructose-specific phosphotransferase system IIA component (Ntr-type)|uniref:PTS sugar transporter subunit IIA n=1 Tax=Oceanispirochaeta sp. TaxID=2035350 RepID=UPI00262FD125|nr:PTS sugar transporter subunit IIA [Oceanispirochaeta sp.]MDA3955826.1 PTS sugar transporter subunit IIA [Oceanispirochaeta sp.]